MNTVRLLSSSSFVVIAAASACHSSPAPAAATATFPAQVAAGQTLFHQHCAACHGDAGQGKKGPRLVGLAMGALPLDPPADREHRHTRFVTVADVADFVVTSMPPKRPGSLTTDEYLAILAFDLHANGIDLGQDPLTLAKAKTLVIPR